MKTQKTNALKLCLKTSCLLLMAFLGSYVLTAQSTLNTSGGSKALSSGTFDYAIGEMAVVSTQSNGNITVTQGLLQIDDATLSISEEIFSDKNLKVFPNPAKNILHIKPSLEMAGELSLQLFDIQGRRIMQKTFDLQSGIEKQELDLSSLEAATYMLNVQFNHGEQNYRQNYKIIKTGGN